MTAWQRWLRFNGVGLAGLALQITTVGVLADAWHVDYRIATIAGVAAAVIHNFAWHWRWTWADRAAGSGMARTFVRFAVSNGVVSFTGNLVVMTALVGGAGVRAAPANLVAVALCGVANYWVADRAVFARHRHPL